MYYVITFLGIFDPIPFFCPPSTPIIDYVIQGCSLTKKHTVLSQKYLQKKLTHIANPVLYQYYQPTYLHIFFFEIGIFFFSSLSKYYLFWCVFI